MAMPIFQTFDNKALLERLVGDFSGKGLTLSNGSNYNSLVKQNTKTPKLTNKSIPEGINFRVLISLEINAPDNITLRVVKNPQAILGTTLKSPHPIRTKIPLLSPIIRETLLPFLSPRNPPNIRKRL